jgi:hypothetical protein
MFNMLFSSQIWRKNNDNLAFNGISTSSFSSVDGIMFSESDNKKCNLFKENELFCKFNSKSHSFLFKSQNLIEARNSFLDTNNFFNSKVIKIRIRKTMEKNSHTIKEKIYNDVLEILTNILFKEIHTKCADFKMQDEKSELNISKIWRYDHLNFLSIQIDGKFIGFIDYIKQRTVLFIYELCKLHGLPTWRFEDVLLETFGDYFFTNIKFGTQLAVTDFCNYEK